MINCSFPFHIGPFPILYLFAVHFSPDNVIVDDEISTCDERIKLWQRAESASWPEPIGLGWKSSDFKRRCCKFLWPVNFTTLCKSFPLAMLTNFLQNDERRFSPPRSCAVELFSRLPSRSPAGAFSSLASWLLPCSKLNVCS